MTTNPSEQADHERQVSRLYGHSLADDRSKREQLEAVEKLDGDQARRRRQELMAEIAMSDW